MKDKKNRLYEERVFVVAGLGDLGLVFAKKLSEYGAVFGVSKNPKQVDLTEYICTDLLNKEEVIRTFGIMPSARKLIYLHLVGRFAFQDDKHPIKDENMDGVDDDILNSNLETFRNVLPCLIKYLRDNPFSNLKAVGIGSAIDIYDIPFLDSYTYSKNELRKELRSFYGNPETFGRASTLFINISTVSGKQLLSERPFISKEFCLTPEEVVNGSLGYVLDKQISCLEMTLIKPNPSFSEPDYLSIPEIKQRWYKDMFGGKING